MSERSSLPDLVPQLFRFMERFVQLPRSVQDALRPLVKLKHVRKGGYLLHAGEVCREFLFITEGCTRLYLLNDDKEVSVWFGSAGGVGSEIQSLISGAPSKFFVEALQPLTCLSIGKQDLDALRMEHRAVETFQRLLWEDTIIHIIDRVTSFQFRSAEERYRELMARKDLLQAIPQKHLASYLGITPTSLSRLRASLDR
jgi:CRP/FNR family transcriptional regulator, anaerobic regulatory protein